MVQGKRLGRQLSGIREVYSHVTQPMIDALLADLHHRWERILIRDDVWWAILGSNQ